MSLSQDEENRIIDNALTMIGNVNTNNRFILSFFILLGILSYWLFDFSYWWSIPVICGIWQILEEIMRVWASVFFISHQIEIEIKRKKSKK